MPRWIIAVAGPVHDHVMSCHMMLNAHAPPTQLNCTTPALWPGQIAAELCNSTHTASLASKTVFSKVNPVKGFHQVPVSPEDELL